MEYTEVLCEAAKRPAQEAGVLLDGLDAETAHVMPDGRCGSIAWLLWHAARQMDVQVAELSGQPTVWESGGWAERLGVPRGPQDFGLGDGPHDIAAVQVANVADLGVHLRECCDAVAAYLGTLSAADLDDIIDRSYTPVVSRGVRLVSVIDDAVSHVGQAAYVRGLLAGWSYVV